MYVQFTSCVYGGSIKMPVNQKKEKNKGFAFITAPEHVYIELIKLNEIEFKGKEITIQDATSTRPRTNVPFKNSKRPQIVVNRYRENQNEFRRRNTVSGQQTYAFLFTEASLEDREKEMLHLNPKKASTFLRF